MWWTPWPMPTPRASCTVTQEPVTQNRQAVPPALSELVMRCLEKHPADRWQRADEVLAQLEAMATPSGGMTPTATGPVSAAQVDAALRQSHPARVAALFASASLAVLAFVYLLVWKLGLPDWGFAGAVGLLLVGVPIMFMTGLAERRRMLASTGRLPALPLPVPAAGTAGSRGARRLEAALPRSSRSPSRRRSTLRCG